MSRNLNTPSATCRSAAAEVVPAGGPMAGNSQDGTGACSGTPLALGRPAESYPMVDPWNFRLLV